MNNILNKNITGAQLIYNKLLKKMLKMYLFIVGEL